MLRANIHPKEIDLIQSYLNDKKLKVKTLNRGFTWMDTGTFDSLLEASNFISLVS